MGSVERLKHHLKAMEDWAEGRLSSVNTFGFERAEEIDNQKILAHAECAKVWLMVIEQERIMNATIWWD